VDNIKMDLGEIGWGGEDWIGLAQDRDQWRALVNVVMNLWIPYSDGKFSNGCKSIELVISVAGHLSIPEAHQRNQWSRMMLSEAVAVVGVLHLVSAICGLAGGGSRFGFGGLDACGK
jgi:hypothetical protein